jgi:hypothetical protein
MMAMYLYREVCKRGWWYNFLCGGRELAESLVVNIESKESSIVNLCVAASLSDDELHTTHALPESIMKARAAAPGDARL